MTAVRSSSRSAKRRFDPASIIVLVAFALLLAFVALTRGLPRWAVLLYVVASACSFALYAVDKAAAIDKRDRIPESMLLWLGFVGGWPGAIAAQQVLRHKTAKQSFRIRFWLSVIANMAVFAWATMVTWSAS